MLNVATAGNGAMNPEVQLPQSAQTAPLIRPAAMAIRQTIRRTQLRQIVPLADTTIYDMERRGEFPRRFYLTSKCVAWDLEEVQQWLAARRRASNEARIERTPDPDVTKRKRRPLKIAPAS
jgi:prophage regulatory protein